jgi:hypothetical protein
MEMAEMVGKYTKSGVEYRKKHSEGFTGRFCLIYGGTKNPRPAKLKFSQKLTVDFTDRSIVSNIKSAVSHDV